MENDFLNSINLWRKNLLTWLLILQNFSIESKLDTLGVKWIHLTQKLDKYQKIINVEFKSVESPPLTILTFAL